MTPTVISADAVRKADGILRVPPDAIITPLARDEAAARGIRIEREAAATVRPVSTAHTKPTFSAADLAKRMDHTLLSPTATPAAIETACAEALEHGFASLCIFPVHCRRASELLGGKIAVCAVAGFPSGAHRTAIKVDESVRCVEDGASEIDLVARHDLVKTSDYQCYYDEISQVRAAIGATVALKVIIEAPLLMPEEIVQATALAAHAGADFVKTSTGVYGRARVEDVQLMRRAAPKHVRIKAAGGIRTLAGVRAMLEAGADRLGTSASLAILGELVPK